MPVLRPLLVALTGLAWFCGAPAANALSFSLSFTPGHYYGITEHYGGIDQRDADGNSIAWFEVPQDPEGPSVPIGVPGNWQMTRVRSPAFGPDGLLYVYLRYWNSQRAYTQSIVAMNSDGVVARYAIPDTPGDWDIVFDRAGQFYYGQYKFEIGNPGSAESFFQESKFAFHALAGGGFLAKDEKAIYELNSVGDVVRELYRVPGYHDRIRTATFDPQTNALFISGSIDRGTTVPEGIWKVDPDSGELMKKRGFDVVQDLSITREGLLLASGDSGESPTLYTQDLELVREFDFDAYHITRYVPEPSAIGIALVGGILVGCFSNRHFRKGVRTFWPVSI